MSKENLFGLTLYELQAVVKNFGMPSYTARQIAEWIYLKNAHSIEEMSNISKVNRQKLSESYEILLHSAVKVQTSRDGTKKYLFPAGENTSIEAVFIPETARNTLCISTQAGCKRACVFCMTGKQGMQGQLSTAEILNQIVSLPERDTLTNIVFMGMGEPFDNSNNVMKSLEILTADWGLEMSHKRITVSTVGIIPGIERFLKESKCHLAVSLNSAFTEERKKLMPVESQYPIKDVVKMLKEHDLGKQRRVSFEYIMFRGLNDTNLHLKELCRLLNGINCRINLIRFHPIPDSPLQASSEETIENFKNMLHAKGITASVRASRGLDIYAACGLLSTKDEDREDRENVRR